MFGPGVEVTDVVLAARRVRTLAKLAAVPRTRDVNAAFVAPLEALDGNPNDVPFAAAYEIDALRKQATLKGALHVEGGGAVAPYLVDPRSPRAPWPFGRAFESGTPLLVAGLAARFGVATLGPGPEPTAEALVHPIAGSPPGGAFVVGSNRRRTLDPPCRDFLDLLAAQFVSLFAAAVEAAGLSLVVDCPPLAAPVAVDREMRAKIVVNLVSSAPKFTREGEIRVALRERAQHAELVVGDTGVGIDEADQPHVFERFFRGNAPPAARAAGPRGGGASDLPQRPGASLTPGADAAVVGGGRAGGRAAPRLSFGAPARSRHSCGGAPGGGVSGGAPRRPVWPSNARRNWRRGRPSEGETATSLGGRGRRRTTKVRRRP